MGVQDEFEGMEEQREKIRKGSGLADIECAPATPSAHRPVFYHTC
jgi:hypothetical protein